MRTILLCVAVGKTWQHHVNLQLPTSVLLVIIVVGVLKRLVSIVITTPKSNSTGLH